MGRRLGLQGGKYLLSASALAGEAQPQEGWSILAGQTLTTVVGVSLGKVKGFEIDAATGTLTQVKLSAVGIPLLPGVIASTTALLGDGLVAGETLKAVEGAEAQVTVLQQGLLERFGAGLLAEMDVASRGQGGTETIDKQEEAIASKTPASTGSQVLDRVTEVSSKVEVAAILETVAETAKDLLEKTGLKEKLALATDGDAVEGGSPVAAIAQRVKGFVDSLWVADDDALEPRKSIDAVGDEGTVAEDSAVDTPSEMIAGGESSTVPVEDSDVIVSPSSVAVAKAWPEVSQVPKVPHQTLVSTPLTKPSHRATLPLPPSSSQRYLFFAQIVLNSRQSCSNMPYSNMSESR